MWGIYDLQREELRPEVYETREQAICEFADYWADICYYDYFDCYEFPEFLTEEEKDELVTSELRNMDNETFLNEYGFEPVEIGGNNGIL